MEYLEHFTTFIQLMAGVNFAFIVVDFVKQALEILFSSKEFLIDKYKIRNAEIVTDLESIKAMAPIRTPDGLSNEESLSRLKQNYIDFSWQWRKECRITKVYIESIKNTPGFRVLFLFTSIYSVLALIFIGISKINPSSWNFEFFLCIFNLLSCVIFAIYLSSILRYRGRRVTKEGVECILFVIGALTIGGIVTLINHIFVTYDLCIPPASWICNLLSFGCVIIPVASILSATLYIFINDYYYKRKVDKLYIKYDSRFNELHRQKLETDTTYRQFRKVNFN